MLLFVSSFRYCILLLSPVIFICSTIITQSAPSGTMAPVIIFAHWFLPIFLVGIFPALSTSIISSSFLISSFLQAKPSIADLSNGGILMSELTSSARIRPKESIKFILSLLRVNCTDFRTTSRASSNFIIIYFLEFKFNLSCKKPSGRQISFSINILIIEYILNS